MSGRFRVAVTRSRERAGALSRMLRGRGVEAIECPAIRTVPIPHPPRLANVLRNLASFDWIVFTSAAGVEEFFRRLSAARPRVSVAARSRLAAIGPGTARALTDVGGRRPDLVPRKHVAEDLSASLGRVRGLRILIPRARKAREILPRQLKRRGARVRVLPLYRTLPDRAGLRSLKRAVTGGKVDAVVFTSSSTAENSLRFMGAAGRRAMLPEGNVAAVSIGPVTSATLARLGVRPAVEAASSSMRGVADALVRYHRNTRQSRRSSGAKRRP